MTLRVLVVADDPLVRAGLATLLADRPELDIVGQLPAGEPLLDNLPVYRPEVILWDLGWEADEPAVPLQDIAYPLVVLLPDEELAGDVLAAGVRGLLFRNAAADQIAAALESALQGLLVLDPDLAEALRPAGYAELPPPAEDLTPREQEVLQLLAEGLTNRAIAQELAVSEHTIKFHVNAIMTKLDAQSRTEAVVRATRLGLIML
jgi:DNA-binding NarL/FixJ family response regulator